MGVGKLDRHNAHNPEQLLKPRKNFIIERTLLKIPQIILSKDVSCFNWMLSRLAFCATAVKGMARAVSVPT